VGVGLTAEAVGHVGLQDDLAEDGGQRQRLVALVPQRDVAVAGLQAVEGQQALANQLVVVVVDADAQHRQVREDHLGRRERDGGKEGRKETGRQQEISVRRRSSAWWEVHLQEHILL